MSEHETEIFTTSSENILATSTLDDAQILAALRAADAVIQAERS